MKANFLVDLRSTATLTPPPFDAAALDHYLDIVGAPGPMIRDGLAMVPSLAWQDGLKAIITLFGLDRANHCFHASPITWASFHEPQITAGLVHFLNSGSHQRRLARAVALVQAAALSADLKIDVTAARSARCVAEEQRTDILVELTDGHHRFGASIEAKFGHQLTPGQLPKARRLLEAREWELKRSVMLVVAPDPENIDANIMRQNRISGWKSTSWWELLLQLERLITPSDDCDDFRRFRRTIWHRAY